MNVSEIKLQELFARHHPDGVVAATRFSEQLSRVQLEFDLKRNIREHIPDMGGSTESPSSLIYYYIPGTKFGSNQTRPEFSVDGIGLNMGCPIRLSRALNVLFNLPDKDQKECIHQIKCPDLHLACVEELLWLTVWKSPTEVGRGGELVSRKDKNKPHDVDWFLFANGCPIYLEAKFRPTDWRRVSDRPVRCINKESFLKGLGRKFPNKRNTLSRFVCAITGFADPFEGSSCGAANKFLHEIEAKLTNSSSLHAILYRSLIGPVYVFSLDEGIAHEVATSINPPKAEDYPLWYKITINRRLREQSMKAYSAELPRHATEVSRLVCCIVSANDVKALSLPKLPNRSNIKSRSAKTGEPEFENVPAFLTSQR